MKPAGLIFSPQPTNIAVHPEHESYACLDIYQYLADVYALRSGSVHGARHL